MDEPLPLYSSSGNNCVGGQSRGRIHSGSMWAGFSSQSNVTLFHAWGFSNQASLPLNIARPKSVHSPLNLAAPKKVHCYAVRTRSRSARRSSRGDFILRRSMWTPATGSCRWFSTISDHLLYVDPPLLPVSRSPQPVPGRRRRPVPVEVFDTALVAAADTPCYLDEVYLAELRDLLRAADHALLAGKTTINTHGPYVALTMAREPVRHPHDPARSGVGVGRSPSRRVCAPRMTLVFLDIQCAELGCQSGAGSFMPNSPPAPHIWSPVVRPGCVVSRQMP